MYSVRSVKHGLNIAAAAVLLAGCGSGTPSQLSPGANSANGATGLLQNGGLLTTSVRDPRFALRKSDGRLHTHLLHEKIAANVKTLWVGDSGDNDVQIFTFPKPTYIGSAPPPPEGFSEPQGMCSDKNGNVFIANTGNSTIDEYAPNGTFTQALSDPGEFPAGCAVDPKSGTLAVSNIISTSDNAGGISLYKNASGSPQQLTDPNMFEVFFLAYYGKTGKLYYSGFNNSFYAAIDSYIDGTFKPFIVSGETIGFPGTVAWGYATKSLVIGDQDTFSSPTFLQVRSTGKVIGTTTLSCSSGDCDAVQAAVHGNYIVVPDAGNLGIGIFPYPAGGNALYMITGFGQPIGAAVSVVKQ
jgi:SMP-30/Gluconolactonase/LRE-like region